MDKPTNNPANSGDGTARGPATGGGGTPDGEQGPPAQVEREQAHRDEANLEYTRKATDLALERLKDQMAKGEADQELLDKLGWTRDDLARFVRSFEEKRRASATNSAQGKEAKRDLDDTLRRLNLRPKGTTLGGNRAADDQQRGLKESRRITPPREYLDKLKDYTQGTARGGK